MGDTPNDTISNTSSNAGSNLVELSVSELSGAVQRQIEENFGRVRVRGELGRVARPASGHLYFDLKDNRAVLAAVMWKGTTHRLCVQPEQGLEVVLTGKLTTYPGQSRYQLVVEALEPAGEGALMALLEARKKQLAAEGLFDAERKKTLPYLPEVIGVITSPSGAVIRDILHRLADRFPRHVLVWPVRVQGATCAEEVAHAIAGFNALSNDGPNDEANDKAVPRPDVLIVARGGGSLEDLWPFNEEIVVRTAAQSDIPLISAIGHETDTTLLDYAADQRAPTPTAAAEMVVPVRAELQATLSSLTARQRRAQARLFDGASNYLAGLVRGLPRLEDMLALPRQRLDSLRQRLGGGLQSNIQVHRTTYDGVTARLSPTALRRQAESDLQRTVDLQRRARLQIGAYQKQFAAQCDTIDRQLKWLGDDLLALSSQQLDGLCQRLGGGLQSNIQVHRAAHDTLSARLTPMALRTRADIGLQLVVNLQRRARLQIGACQDRLAAQFAAIARQLKLLGHESTLERGFALVLDAGGKPVRQAAQAPTGSVLTIALAQAEQINARVEDTHETVASSAAHAIRADDWQAERKSIKKSAPSNDKQNDGQGELL